MQHSLNTLPLSSRTKYPCTTVRDEQRKKHLLYHDVVYDHGPGHPIAYARLAHTVSVIKGDVYMLSMLETAARQQAACYIAYQSEIGLGYKGQNISAANK